MTKLTRLCIISCLLLNGITILSAQNKDLETRYVTAAAEQLSHKDYEKAFMYINKAMELGKYDETNLPAQVEVLSENIYYSYLQEIRDKRLWQQFYEVKDMLAQFPFLTSDRIARMVKTINTLDTQENMGNKGVPGIVADTAVKTEIQAPNTAVASTGQTSNITAPNTTQPLSTAQVPQSSHISTENSALTAELQIQLQELNKKLAEEADKQSTLSQNLELQQKIYDRVMTNETPLPQATNDNNNAFLVIIIIVLSIFFVLVCVSAVIGIVVGLKNTKKQQKHFEDTLTTVAKMNRSHQENTMFESIPYVQLEDGTYTEGDTSAASARLPQLEMTENEKEELAALALQCEKVGTEIDKITGRKNNSKMVAEMVYKLCRELKLSPYESMLYFAVALVYDAGFLQVDPTLLLRSDLSDDEKYRIREHVMLGTEKMDFIPDKYRPVFIDGVLYHHENTNGSGYPQGISTQRIPMIARMIHVCEAYVSMVSRRNYKNISDKETAYQELKSHPEYYDTELVLVLDKLI